MKRTLHVLRVGVLIAAVLTGLYAVANDRPSWGSARKIFLEVLAFATITFAVGDFVFSRLSSHVAGYRSGVRWTIFVIANLMVSGAGSILGSALVIAAGLEQSGFFWMLVYLSYKIIALVALVIGVTLGHLGELKGQLHDAQLKLRTQELERERALKLATEARLSSLESRVHPHFLFNTLNSISSLIPADPWRAERLVGRLAALLRFSLDAQSGSLVTLEQEMKVVRDYLEIEQARLGERLQYNVEAAPDLDEMHLPAMSVQTLVENSIKHAVAPDRQGGEIRVQAHRNGSGLCVDVSDDGPGFSLEAAPSGHGLDNLRARLTALFGGAADLTVERVKGWTTVSLRVPADMH